MANVDADMTTRDLMRIAADYSQKRMALSDEEKKFLVELLKQHAQQELDYGEEIEYEMVRVVRRVTGAVSVFFT